MSQVAWNFVFHSVGVEGTVMESRDPFLRVSVSKVSGLETFNIEKYGLVKFLQFKYFCLLYFQVRNN